MGTETSVAESVLDYFDCDRVKPIRIGEAVTLSKVLHQLGLVFYSQTLAAKAEAVATRHHVE